MSIQDYRRRFMALPRVEKHRLNNLVSFIAAGNKLNESLLRGFPQESKDILEGMLRATHPELQLDECDD